MNHNLEQEFWQEYERFLKTTPITETPHPKSANLSALCMQDLPQAFSVFREIEIAAITRLYASIPDIKIFQDQINQILHSAHRIFFIGCGASGRLAVLLSCLYTKYYPKQASQVIAIPAGGDISLIKSIEQFEDKKELGIQQLICQGYTHNDLVIGLSASGDSPFILGALEYALQTSCYPPYLVCNNPKSTILERNYKSAELINQIKVLSLDVGPMALTGSSRLQATTAMQIICGSAILHQEIKPTLDQSIKLITALNLNNLAKLTNYESNLVQSNEFILYVTNNNLLALSILADTTERSPTFNLPAFENQNLAIANISPFYMSYSPAKNSIDAWRQILHRELICLNWSEFKQTSRDYIAGFDLSTTSLRYNANYLPQKQHHATWTVDKDKLWIELSTLKESFAIPPDYLLQSILFKFLLNSHSTLMLGKLGYFQGNLMLNLKPSNHKLIDRTIRYAIFILKSQYKLTIEYKVVANYLFAYLPHLKPNESIVLKIVNHFISV